MAIVPSDELGSFVQDPHNAWVGSSASYAGYVFLQYIDLVYAQLFSQHIGTETEDIVHFNVSDGPHTAGRYDVGIDRASCKTQVWYSCQHGFEPFGGYVFDLAYGAV